MGAWMCLLCGHGRFIRLRSMAKMCDRQGCGYVERCDDLTGARVRQDHRASR